MFSIRAKYKEGQFHLDEPVFQKTPAKVIITLIEPTLEPEPGEASGELTEEQKQALRKYERFAAKGKIVISQDNIEETMQLHDYSSGGLSFLSVTPFEKGLLLKAALKDPLDLQNSVLDFEFEVARSVLQEHHYQIGCKFTDNIDEELWHSLMRMH